MLSENRLLWGGIDEVSVWNFDSESMIEMITRPIAVCNAGLLLQSQRILRPFVTSDQWKGFPEDGKTEYICCK